MKKDRLSTFLLILILIAGLSLMLYPSFSDYWNSLHQTRAISKYNEELAKLDKEDYSHLWEEAIAYNRQLTQRNSLYVLTEDERIAYDNVLNHVGTGIMGYIEIPSIKVMLGIYHGTSDAVLQSAVGHLDWTSLPVGGETTHCVMSGHRGLPSAKLFSDLDKLREGDTFLLHILDETLTYEVDQILIVLPDETEALMIEEGKDLCTLVTCTPYGVNSHRLLVRGHRIANAAQAANVRVTADALRIQPLVVAAVLFFPFLLLILLILSLFDRKKKQ